MTFEPNWVSPPGATIERILSAREISFDEFADALHLSRSEVSDLIAGTVRIDDELASLLSSTVGSSARFWVERDQKYQSEILRVAPDNDEALIAWAREMPTKSLIDFGLLERVRGASETSNHLLEFFGCRSLADWNARYRAGVNDVVFRSSEKFVSDDLSILVWRRMGEIQVDATNLPAYDAELFETVVNRVKGLTAFKNPGTVVQKLQEECREAGVAVTTARAPQGCRASGATWWNDNGNPVIHLSFRHLSNDHFWFTFFHECAHVLLHEGDFVDFDSDESDLAKDRRENEANAFASSLLVPKQYWDRLLGQKITPKSVISFAKSIGIAPGIVVGQLEKTGIVKYGRFGFLKHRYRWGDDPFVPSLK